MKITKYSWNTVHHISCTRRHQVKAEDICTYCLWTHIVHTSERHGENGKSTVRMDRWEMDGKGKVRWTFDGYLQTENMEEKPRMLASWRPSWKEGGIGGKNRKMTVNDWMRGRGREEISERKEDAQSTEDDCAEERRDFCSSQSPFKPHQKTQALSTSFFVYFK